VGGRAARFMPAMMMTSGGGFCFDDAVIQTRRRQTWVPNRGDGGRGVLLGSFYRAEAVR
jgi:hypothetical protein